MERIHRTAASQFARDLEHIQQSIEHIQQSIVEEGVENVGKRTDSIGSDGDGLRWQEFIGLPQVRSQETVNVQQSIVEQVVEIVGKRTPSDAMETGCRGKNPSDCRESVCERLRTYTAKYILSSKFEYG